MGVPDEDFLRMVEGLADVERSAARDWTSFSVRGKRFGYYWPRTKTVGLKQTLSEQLALVSERPEVFEIRSDGFLYLFMEEVPPELQKKAIEAEDLCPTGAITLVGDDGKSLR